MIKRVLSVFLVAVICFVTCGCKTINSEEKFKKYSFDYFDTATTIVGYAKSQEEFDEVCEEIFSSLET